MSFPVDKRKDLDGLGQRVVQKDERLLAPGDDENLLISRASLDETHQRLERMLPSRLQIELQHGSASSVAPGISQSRRLPGAHRHEVDGALWVA